MTCIITLKMGEVAKSGITNSVPKPLNKGGDK